MDQIIKDSIQFGSTTIDYDIEFAQQRLPERDAGRVGNVDLADMVHPRLLADAVV